MIHRAHHPHEDRLFDCYLTSRNGEPPDPPTAEHLADCPECRARYADLARFMDGLRAAAEQDTDAVFTADRLAAQQVLIARRLEHVGRPARVLSFPGRSGAPATGTIRPHRATRWIAGAAAAGIFVGVGLGVFYDSDMRAGRFRHTAVASARPAPAVSTDAAADEAFLNELELAADRPHTRELAPFDALTPHVREISNSIR